MAGTDRVNPTPSGVKLTYEDLVLLPEDGLRHELIDGEHYVTASPNVRHQRISATLYLMIGRWLEDHPIGEVFYSPLDVLFSDFDVVEPDLLYMSKGRAAEILTANHVRGVPELVIEIGSPSTRGRDETIKRRLYERVGVSEYWVVDPETDIVRIYRRDGERFARPQELAREAGDVLNTPLLAGLDLPLARIFKE